jgi:hypothetical protein
MVAYLRHPHTFWTTYFIWSSQDSYLIKSDNISSGQDKLSQKTWYSLSWLDEILSCILTKFWCIDQYCHLHIFYLINYKWIFWHNHVISITILISLKEIQIGLFPFLKFFKCVWNSIWLIPYFLKFLSVLPSTSPSPTLNGILKFYFFHFWNMHFFSICIFVWYLTELAKNSVIIAPFISI